MLKKQFNAALWRAYGISCGVTKCNPAPAVSQKQRCSANWVYSGSAESRWSPVCDSAVKPVGKPDALIGQSGLMSGDGKRGGAQALVLAPILDSTH
jgi:hypothetical protein